MEAVLKKWFGNQMIRWASVSALMVVLCIPATAIGGGDERTEHEVPGEGTPADEDERTEFDERTPEDLERDRFVEQREFEGQQLRDEAIVRLQDLVENTPKDDPDRAEYLYNLAEQYWDRSRYYRNSAIEQQDECYVLEDEGKDEEANRCWLRKEDMEAEASRRREESIELYAEIIQEYPDFEDLDTVYFQLGSNMMDEGEEDNGIQIFRRLLSEFPNTRYQPRVYLYFGDHYFDNQELFDALDAYQNAVEFPDSPIYQYARYKKGWTYFNLDNYQRALEEFLKVHDLASEADEGTAERAMRSQVRTDIVRAYARIGSPDQAIGFFQDLAPEREDWVRLSELLAMYYGNEAQFVDSSAMYNNLIEANSESHKVVDYQYEIARNETTIDSYSEEALQELMRMMELVDAADEGAFSDDQQKYEDEIRPRVEEASRNWANTYHREAQRTQNEDLFVMAHYLYNAYLHVFPETEGRYEMSFFHAELLFDLGEYDEAAAAYERTLDIDPDGQYTEDIVLATMLALLEEVEASEERAELDTTDLDEEDEDAIPEPQKLAEEEQRLMRAGQNYIEHAPDGEQIVDVKYTKARTYYDHDHYERAAELFESIAFSHSDHELAEVSANLHLDSLNMLQKFSELNEAVEAYLAEEPVDDPEFQDDLYEMNMAIRFNLCVDLDEEERHEEAAHCYVEYVEDFPDAEHGDLALDNAALNFERIREIEAAIQMRQVLLERHPNSELVPDTLYNLGQNFHAWAIYGQASRYYEMYVANFPEKEHAEEALQNAGAFRRGIGEYDRAVTNFEQFVKLYGDDNPEQAAEAFFEIAQIYEEEGRDEDAYQQYRDYIREYGDQGVPDWLLEAHLKIGLHYWDQDRRGARQDALEVFEETVELFDNWSQEQQAEVGTLGRDARAQAQFMIAEDLYEDAEAIALDSEDGEELQEATEEKMKAAQEAREVYTEVMEFGQPDWAIAAAYRIGRGFHDFAEEVRNSPVPEELEGGPRERYKLLLEDEAMQFEHIAAQMYEAALDASSDHDWYSEYTELAETHLAEIQPENFRQPSELRAEPVYIKDRYASGSFITETEDEDRIEDLVEEDFAEEEGADDEDDVIRDDEPVEGDEDIDGPAAETDSESESSS